MVYPLRDAGAPGANHFALALSSLAFALPLVTQAAENARIDGLSFEIAAFDADPVAAGHPRVFFSPSEIERARKRIRDDPSSKQVFDRLIRDADKHLDIVITPLDESWWAAAKSKPWEDTYPQVFQHTMREPATLAAPAEILATAWLLTAERKYSDQAKALLLNLTSYSFTVEHYDVGMNYAIWTLAALQAYDALLPELAPAERAQLDAMFTRAARAIAANDVYWIKNNIGGGLNNHLAWHKMMLGLFGLFYARPEMVEFCLHGPRGLAPLLEEGLMDDGLWCESSLTYHFTAIVPMAIFAECQRRTGGSPAFSDLSLANGRTLKQAFDAMFNVLAPDGLIPPVGDAYGSRAKLWDHSIYEYGWTAWGDPSYAWLLSKAKARSPRSLFSPPLPQDPPAPSIRSMLLPEHGYAFLRSHDDGAYWDNPDARCAFLTFDRSGVHSNADKLSLMLFGQGRMLLSDVEGKATVPHAFSSRIQRELNRGGLSQNTVMIDGQDQRGTSRPLRVVEYHDLPEEKRITAADDEGLLYAGVRQMRTVCLTPDYVLDVFQVDCGAQDRQIDWIAHAIDETATVPPEHNPLTAGLEPWAFPQVGAWPWLREPRTTKPSGVISVDWRAEGARLRLVMPDPGAERVIFCGYPATDEATSGTIPMLMVRRHARGAVFAALWLVGDRPREATLTTLPAQSDHLVYAVNADGRRRQHLIPLLKP